MVKLEGMTNLTFDRYVNPDEHWTWYKVESEKELNELLVEIEFKYGEDYLWAFDKLEGDIQYPVWICLNDDEYGNGFTELLEDSIREAREFFKKFGLKMTLEEE